jgi:hypothetical protein
MGHHDCFLRFRRQRWTYRTDARPPLPMENTPAALWTFLEEVNVSVCVSMQLGVCLDLVLSQLSTVLTNVPLSTIIFVLVACVSAVTFVVVW